MEDRFRVYTEDGKTVWIRVIRCRIPFTNYEEIPSRIEGTAQLCLEDGSLVNMSDENTFRIATTGELLRRQWQDK
jgi:hypothetical protein